jgi:hypothetical protein
MPTFLDNFSDTDYCEFNHLYFLKNKQVHKPLGSDDRNQNAINSTDSHTT